MRIILLGAPGAGKGTQARFISLSFKIPAISTGDMLRAAIANKTELGLKAKSIMDSGQLVSDDVIIPMVFERIAEPDCENGFIFDGFPRTLPQAEALTERGLHIDHIVNFVIDDEVIVERLSGRRVHAESGRVYHMINNPPKVPNKDDVTGDALIQREDDKEEVIRERLKVYHQQTEPVVKYYKNWALSGSTDHPHFVDVSAEAPVDSIQQHLLSQLQQTVHNENSKTRVKE